MLELASKFDLAGHVAKASIVANVCQWVYRSTECSYTGSDYFDVNGNTVPSLSQDVCGKRVATASCGLAILHSCLSDRSLGWIDQVMKLTATMQAEILSRQRTSSP